MTLSLNILSPVILLTVLDDLVKSAPRNVVEASTHTARGVDVASDANVNVHVPPGPVVVVYSVGGDDVPTAPVTVAVSLADKLDTLVGFFAEGMPPTGSKDPFALRRATLAVLATFETGNIRVPLLTVFNSTEGLYVDQFRQRQLEASRQAEQAAREAGIVTSGGAIGLALAKTTRMGFGEIFLTAQLWDLLDFFADRLKVQQREAGVRHDLIDAVFALGGEDDLVRLLARVRALQGFVGTDEGANLLAGYKRAANILKADPNDKNNRHPELVSGSISPNDPSGEADKWMLKQVQHDELGDAERGLLLALDSAEPKAAAAIEAEKFEDAMAALASLRAPIDAFFDGVMVNDPDPAKRAFRLGLLARFRDAVHRVADFSRIEG